MNLFRKLSGRTKETPSADDFTGMDAESLPLAASESAEYYSFLNPSSRETLADERVAGVIGGTGLQDQKESDDKKFPKKARVE